MRRHDGLGSLRLTPGAEGWRGDLGRSDAQSRRSAATVQANEAHPAGSALADPRNRAGGNLRKHGRPAYPRPGPAERRTRIALCGRGAVTFLPRTKPVSSFYPECRYFFTICQARIAWLCCGEPRCVHELGTRTTDSGLSRYSLCVLGD